MPAPYSQDLRRRVINAYYNKEYYNKELCWSKFKEFLRSREPRTQEELDRAITEAIAQITEDDIFGWFAHFGLFI